MILQERNCSRNKRNSKLLKHLKSKLDFWLKITASISDEAFEVEAFNYLPIEVSLLFVCLTPILNVSTFC